MGKRILNERSNNVHVPRVPCSLTGSVLADSNSFLQILAFDGHEATLILLFALVLLKKYIGSTGVKAGNLDLASTQIFTSYLTQVKFHGISE